MANKSKLLWWILISPFLLFSNFRKLAYGKTQVPCYFVFGDSLFDNGNNNRVVKLMAKCNYPPFGIDFRHGPTGRFSNGKNTADVIAELLGFDDYIPNFTTARLANDMLKGVNYAAGSAGIRNETGRALGDVISLDEQLRNHRFTVSRIIGTLRNKDSAMKYLNKCIYVTDMGNNDYTLNYFMPDQLYNTSKQYNVDEYATVLIQQYSQKLKTLYDLGARKVAVTGLLQSGCTPGAMSAYGTNGSCVEKINDAIKIFNSRLIPLVTKLNAHLPGAKFTYINFYQIDAESTEAFRFTKAGCCKLSSTGLCTPYTVPCSNRTEYAYYDSVHPTEAKAMILGRRAYSVQSLDDAFPVDIKRLAQL